MPEPQVSSQADKARGRAETAGQTAEQRTFNEATRDQRSAARGAQDAVAESGRRVAETSRAAGRQMTEAWRMAFDPLLSVQYDIPRMWDEMWRHTFGFRQPPGASPMRSLGLLSTGFFGLPPTDLKETKDAHVLEIELAGLKPQDVDVSVDDDSLVICGQKIEENADATAAYHVNERRYGRFERVFPLPADVRRDHIEAQFRNGVLKITLPKEADAAPRRSKIEVRP